MFPGLGKTRARMHHGVFGRFVQGIFPGSRQSFMNAGEVGRITSNSMRLRLVWLSWVRLAMLVALAVSTLLFSRDSVGTMLDSIRSSLLWFTLVCIVPASLYFPVLLAVQNRRALSAIAIMQIIQDSLFAGVMVVATGGSSSGFTFFFPLMIIIAGLVLPGMGSRLSVLLSALFLLVICLWESGLMEAPDMIAPAIMSSTPDDVVYTYVINLIAFVVVAVLANFLMSQAQRSDIQKERYRTNLEDLKVLHETIVSSLDTGLVTIGLDDRIIHLNRAAEDLLGVSLKAVKGLPLSDVMPQMQVPIAEVEGDVDIRLAGPTGTDRYGLLAVKPLLSGRWEMVGRLIRIQDVTELRRMEIQRKADERLATIGKMSAVVAHEIRNPLAAISASAQMVAMSREVGEEDKAALGIVVRETDHLNEWISELLEYARPRRLEAVSFEVEHVLSQAVQVSRALPMASGNDFRMELQPGVVVSGDPMRLSRVAINILKNAVEAVAGSGIISVKSFTVGTGATGQLHITFSNDGPVIPPDSLKKIFDVFYTTKARGTGLGLASAVQYCEDFGGTVTVSSSEENGTVFDLTLPMRRDA